MPLGVCCNDNAPIPLPPLPLCLLEIEPVWITVRVLGTLETQVWTSVLIDTREKNRKTCFK